ncbi:FAD-binding oxidoreductase [Vagococcus sp. PNs007]|uniref:FAD-binding oxidoreductase n=1 Tax=Vagococcus proximus TaxID=2991417 RepID=A0ABT5WYB7_9ENTE|nr:FAD-dependent oxidoreductase [Vagococcus proximus]MDF0478745.1 FAD-binding oxidoreductase [Vagococcus proximus]
MKLAIIGGGIVGSSAAFYASQHPEDDVTLFDDETGQATRAAAGIISPWLSQRRNKNWYNLAKSGAALYPSMINELSKVTETTCYRQVGTLLFKKNQALLDKLINLATERKQEAPEIGDIALLSPEQIKEKMPLLTPHSSALFVSGGARVDGRLLIEQLQAGFIAQNGTLIKQRITSLTPCDNGYRLNLTDGSTQTFDKVIVATGAWLPELIGPLGFEVDVRGQKGQLAHFQTKQNTTNWPVVMPQGESDIIPFDNGSLLIGATHENDQNYDLTVDNQVVAEMVESIYPLAPSIENETISEVRVGTRAYTSDFLPFFGEIPELPGLLVASGLGSSGLTTGPIIAKTLIDWLYGEVSVLQPENYTTSPYIFKK